MEFKDKYEEISKRFDGFSKENIRRDLLTDFNFGIPTKIRGNNYFIKLPHSVEFKNASRNIRNLKDLRDLDNFYSVSSEVVSSKRYNQLGFVTARYFVKKDGSKLYVASPNILERFCDYATYEEIKFDNKRLLNKAVMGKKTPAKIEDIELRTLIDAFDLCDDCIEELLDKKQIYLSIMTEECFDEYVKYLISMVFDFSNDFHQKNIMFCKNKQSKKYEHIFVFDKESNLFNYSLARKKTYFDVKEDLYNVHYITNSIYVRHHTESLKEKIDGLLYLAEKGYLTVEQIELMKDISNLKFDEIAKQIELEQNLKVNPKQLDIYKFGSELAGETYEKLL